LNQKINILENQYPKLFPTNKVFALRQERSHLLQCSCFVVAGDYGCIELRFGRILKDFFVLKKP